MYSYTSLAHITPTKLLIASNKDSLISMPQDTLTLTFAGIVGDKHTGFTRKAGAREAGSYEKGTAIRNYRHITIVSEEELADIANNLGIEKILPEWLGANICVKGVDHLTLLPPLTRFVFPSGAVITAYGENTPCINPGNVIAAHYPLMHAYDFPKAAVHKRGLIAWVEAEGIIEKNMACEIQTPNIYNTISDGK